MTNPITSPAYHYAALEHGLKPLPGFEYLPVAEEVTL